jgi:hypothetical protein
VNGQLLSQTAALLILRAIDGFLSGFLVDTSWKQDLTVYQVYDRYEDALLVRPCPGIACSPLIKYQVAARDWRLPVTGLESILEFGFAPCIRQPAAIDVLTFIEPAV